MTKLILASESPRRKELMNLLDINFEAVASNIEEVFNESLDPYEAVIDLARQKAAAISLDYPDLLVLGCDTVVFNGKKYYGKPANEDEARAMIKALSDKTHHVVTGCVLKQGDDEQSFYSQADVTFNALTDQEIKDYIATKEPFGKAGAYAIQGQAAKFIEAIHGDYYAVMGLPIAKLYKALKAKGL